MRIMEIGSGVEAWRRLKGRGRIEPRFNLTAVQSQQLDRFEQPLYQEMHTMTYVAVLSPLISVYSIKSGIGYILSYCNNNTNILTWQCLKKVHGFKIIIRYHVVS